MHHEFHKGMLMSIMMMMMMMVKMMMTMRMKMVVILMIRAHCCSDDDMISMTCLMIITRSELRFTFDAHLIAYDLTVVKGN